MRTTGFACCPLKIFSEECKGHVMEMADETEGLAHSFGYKDEFFFVGFLLFLTFFFIHSLTLSCFQLCGVAWKRT